MIEAEKVNEWKKIEFQRADTRLHAFRFSETKTNLITISFAGSDTGYRFQQTPKCGQWVLPGPKGTHLFPGLFTGMTYTVR